MTGSGSIIAIFAHPDDESIVAGGTLAACAAAGYNVAILSVTRGEQGPIAYPELATRETLGAVRETELRAAASALGLGEGAAECLGYPDGELEWIDPAPVIDDIARRIGSRRPDAIITFGPEGLYWHRDHVAVHRFTLAALERLAEEAIALELYYATWPLGLMERLVSALAERGQPIDLWGLEPDDFGAPAESITAVLDVRPFLVHKLRALRSHRSQLPSGHLFQVIPSDLAESFLGREYFIRAGFRARTEDWLTCAVGRDGHQEPAHCEAQR